MQIPEFIPYFSGYKILAGMSTGIFEVRSSNTYVSIYENNLITLDEELVLCGRTV